MLSIIFLVICLCLVLYCLNHRSGKFVDNMNDTSSVVSFRTHTIFFTFYILSRFNLKISILCVTDCIFYVITLIL